MIQRFPDWPERLVAAVDRRRTQIFVRGQTDCLPTIADIIQEFTGVDLLGPTWRNAYSDDLEALRIIRRFGGNLLEAFRSHLSNQGVEEIDPRLAKRGDLGFVRLTETSQGAALFCGDGLLIPDKVGLRNMPRSYALAAWRI